MAKGIKILLWILGGIVTLGAGFVIYEEVVKKGKALDPLKKIKPAGSNFLFIGDSLTAYSNSFADQLKAQYPGINIKKIAVIGKQTSWMAPQLKQELETGNKYDGIVIMGGVNDIYATGSIESAKTNLQYMYQMAKSNGAKVIALNVIPTATYKLSTAKTTQLTNDLNKWISGDKTHDALIDVNHIVNNGNNGTKPEFLQPDTLHLTDAAHRLIELDFASKVIK